LKQESAWRTREKSTTRGGGQPLASRTIEAKCKHGRHDHAVMIK